MRPLRAFLGMVLIGWMGTWLSSAPATAPRTVRPVSAVTVPATTVAVAITTTTSAPQLIAVAPVPHTPIVRASRAAPRAHITVDQATMDRVVAAIRSYPDWNAELMVMVGRCESGLNPYAVNGSHHNVFQISGATLGLIEEHVALAHQMWVTRGMGPWVASRGCWSG